MEADSYWWIRLGEFAFTHFERIIMPPISSDLFCLASIRSDIVIPLRLCRKDTF